MEMIYKGNSSGLSVLVRGRVVDGPKGFWNGAPMRKGREES